MEHPGTFIEEELQARKWSKQDLARVGNFTESEVNGLIDGKAPVTEDISVKLGNAFSVSPSFFLKLQLQYDLIETRPS